MQQKSKRDIRVGFFILVSFLLFLGAILILGGKRNMFSKNIKISTVFTNISGLRVGDNVRFTGIDVGTVSDIEILSDTAVKVVLSLEKDVAVFIKKDSRTTISTDGMMGNTLVLILPGSTESRSIVAGDRLVSQKALDLDDIMAELKSSGEKINMVADNLIAITDKIKDGEGIFGKLFTDTKLSGEIDRTSKNVEELSAIVNDMSLRLSRGEGIVGRILVDEGFADNLDVALANVKTITVNLQELTSQLRNGESTIGQLLADSTSAEGLSKMNTDLGEAVANLASMAIKLNSPDNALHKFIDDPQFADSLEVMLKNLNEGIIDVQEAAEDLRQNWFIRTFKPSDRKIQRRKEREQKEEE
ncbi:MAG: MCE family protein [Bacteroidales bacterium]|nr:MCE family protein [Bacteroidales bacterium]